MNVRTTAFASLLALCALHGAQAQTFDDDPYFFDPSFAAQGVSLDGIAGPNGTCLEQTCEGVKVARLSNGDTVTAVELYSWHDDGVGGGYQDDGDFALIRHDANGQRLAWTNPSPGYAHYNDQYLLWPNNDTSTGRMVSRLVDVKVVDGYIYVLYEYADGSDSGSDRTRTGLTVFDESGHFVQAKYRLLCQIGECSDSAIGLALLPGYAEDKRLLAIGATYIYGNLADRGIKVKGMVIEDGIAWDNANFGDANSRTFFQPPETLCRAEIRPCVYAFRNLATAIDPVDYNYAYTYLVGNVKWNNSGSDPSGADNNVLVAKLGEDGYPRNAFGTGGFAAVAFNADGLWNDLGMAVYAEHQTQQDGEVAGHVYVAANVGEKAIGVARLDPVDGGVDTSFGNGGLSIKGGTHCELQPPLICAFVNFPEDYAYGMTRDGNRLVIVGSHANTMVFGGSPSRYVSPMVAVVRASDGAFTDFGTQSVQGEQAGFVDVMALGGGRFLAAGHTLTSGEEPLALTARLLPDRIFGSGMEP